MNNMSFILNKQLYLQDKLTVFGFKDIKAYDDLE